MNILHIKRSLLFLFGAIILFSSCKEDKIDLFSGESNVYFSLKRWKTGATGAAYLLEYPIVGKIYTEQWKGVTQSYDSISRSYALDISGADYDTTYIPVSLMGNITDYDRELSYKVGKGDAKEGRDFKILEAKIPANKGLGAFVIQVDRSSIKDTSYYVEFHLIPNNEFQTNYKTIQRSSTDTTKVDICQIRLRISDLLEQPSSWTIISNYFGPFSRKKLYLVGELTGGDLNVFYEQFPALAKMVPWAQMLKRYLLDQEAKGTPVYEEDGVTKMSAGPYA